MTEDEAWRYIQRHYEKHGVDPKELTPRDWFISGFHVGARENNAAYFEALIDSVLVPGDEEKKKVQKARKARRKKEALKAVKTKALPAKPR